MLCPFRHHECVVPRHATLFRHRKREVGFVERELRNVARPPHAGNKVSCDQVVLVIVAGERTDLSVVFRLLQLVKSARCVVESGFRWIFTLPKHQQADGVAHLLQHPDFALEFGVE